jgi:hypothetical protein
MLNRTTTRIAPALPACAAVSPATSTWQEMELAYEIDAYRSNIASATAYGTPLGDFPTCDAVEDFAREDLLAPA